MQLMEEETFPVPRTIARESSDGILMNASVLHNHRFFFGLFIREDIVTHQNFGAYLRLLIIICCLLLNYYVARVNHWGNYSDLNLN